MRKEHPFDFKKWALFLTEVENKPIQWIKGSGLIEHPQYDQRVLEMVQEFKGSDYYDQNFDRTLLQYHHQDLREEEVMALAQNGDNFRELRGVTSAVIYGEHYFEGMWAAMLEKGIWRRLFQKLEELTPEDFPQQY